MYLLDTNILSELRRPEKAKAALVKWSKMQDIQSLYISVITALEIERGIELRALKDPDQARVLRDWLEGQILPAFTGRILPVSLAIARRCARLHVPNPVPERDALIAATAMEYDLGLVTRNVKDFQPTGVVILNP